MSDRNYEERKRHVFRKQVSRHRPEASVSPKAVKEEDRTGKVKLKQNKQTKVKPRLEDTGTVRTDRFLF